MSRLPEDSSTRCMVSLTASTWELLPGGDPRTRVLRNYQVALNFPMTGSMDTVAEATQAVIEAAEPTGILGEHSHRVEISVEWEAGR